MTEVRVPDIGDFKDVEVIEVLVKPGDSVQKEDGLVTLETDKATMDVPSTASGEVTSLAVKVGDKVNQGDLVASVEDAAAPQDSPAAPAEANEPAAVTNKPAGEEKPAAQPEQPVAAAPAGAVTIAVPDLGDFDDVEIIEVLVKPGDSVQKEDGLITLETDKASMEVPTNVAGVVKEMLVKLGGKVSKGDAVAVIETAEQATATAPAQQPAAEAAAPASTQAATPAPAAAAPAPAKAAAPAAAAGSGRKTVHASPAVRKIAREFGVELANVGGSGNHGRILKEDIQAYVRAQLEKGGGASFGFGYELPEIDSGADFEKFGPVETVKLSRIKQLSGPALHRNWLNIPHVTQFDEADVTELEIFRKQHVAEAKAKGFSLSPLAFLVKAATVALKEFPDFNASLQADGKAAIVKKYYNIGIAVDTAGGLVVPVIRDTNTKSVMQIAAEMSEISKKAREGKLGPNEMKGGTFTISSLGGIGGTHFTPIINSPEVAILGVGRSRNQPVWDGSSFQPRLMMPLAVSYDHRVIDGAQGARFITFLSSLMDDIRNIVL